MSGKDGEIGRSVSSSLRPSLPVPLWAMRFVGRSSDVPLPAQAFWAAHGCPPPLLTAPLRGPSRCRDARAQGAHAGSGTAAVSALRLEFQNVFTRRRNLRVKNARFAVPSARIGILMITFESVMRWCRRMGVRNPMTVTTLA